jgi:peptide deformylase
MAKMIKTYKGDLVEYEIYKLVDFYDPILRKPTTPLKLETLDDFKYAHYLAFSLAETLNRLEGLGLSANQVGLPHRVCAVNLGDEIWTMFNPVIIDRSETFADFQEGCLSYPGLYLKINRPDHIKVRFQAVNGEVVEREFDGLTAVCVQHELDHLDGIMYTDKVSHMKLEQAKRKVRQNLKKMKIYLKEREQMIDEVQRNQQIVSEKQKAIPISQEAPTIKILNPTSIQKNEPEKFVYNAG